jgi:hypothetical protein
MKNVLTSLVLMAASLGAIATCAGVGVSAEGGKGRKTELPAAAQGFSGIVEGKVLAAGKGRITLAVEKVTKAWKESKAKDPQALVGQKIVVSPAKTKEGEYAKKVARFLSTLKPDQQLTIEVKHVEGTNFVVLELSEEQRKIADEANS